MNMTQTLTIAGMLALLPLATIIAYVLNKKKEDLHVKIPVRIDEDDDRRK